MRLLANFALLTLLVAPLASANSVVCGSAEGQLRYSRHTGNRGAYLDEASIHYRGLQANRSHRGLTEFSLGLTQRSELDAKPLPGDGEEKTFVARAVGRIERTSPPTEFAEWVICVEQLFPNCHLCP